jgi:hypothetical protein
MQFTTSTLLAGAALLATASADGIFGMNATAVVCSSNLHSNLFNSDNLLAQLQRYSHCLQRKRWRCSVSYLHFEIIQNND